MPREIRLIEAAQLIRCAYSTVYSLVLQGRLSGRQTPTGRWLVSVADARRLAKELNSARNAVESEKK
jgi:predicted site-specific integrase-resolvase